MVGQEVGIYDVFIGINNEPCIALPSSLHIIDHFSYELVLYFLFFFLYSSRLHNTICSSSCHSINVIEIYIECV